MGWNSGNMFIALSSEQHFPWQTLLFLYSHTSGIISLHMNAKWFSVTSTALCISVRLFNYQLDLGSLPVSQLKHTQSQINIFFLFFFPFLSFFLFFDIVILSYEPGLAKTVILSWTFPFSVSISPLLRLLLHPLLLPMSTFASVVQALAFKKSNMSEERQATGDQRNLHNGTSMEVRTWKIFSLSRKNYSKIMEHRQWRCTRHRNAWHH